MNNAYKQKDIELKDRLVNLNNMYDEVEASKIKL